MEAALGTVRPSLRFSTYDPAIDEVTRPELFLFVGKTAFRVIVPLFWLTTMLTV